ncbi:MAG: universal stress protein [Tahibacter sp.]
MRALDVLVYVRRYDSDALAVRAALALARRLDVRLHGLYVAPIPPAAFTSPETVAVLVHESDRRYHEAQSAGDWWQAQLDTVQAAGDWRVAQADPLDAICHAARWNDFIVIERPVQNPDAPLGWGLASRSVFDAGIPLLVVPEGARVDALGKRVVIAWNSSREAIRAVHGALPLLRVAEVVHVLDGSPAAGAGGMLHLPAFDLLDHLRTHGISAQVETFKPGAEIGVALLAAAHAVEADLIVMGAWGHSRVAQLVLGGATRHLFQHSDLPLLVAH